MRGINKLRQTTVRDAIFLTLLWGLLYPLQVIANDAITEDPMQQSFEEAMKLPKPIAAYESYLGHNLEVDATESESYGYRWQGTAPEQPDWSGLRRDTAYFVGYQFAIIAALYMAPSEISGWDSDEKDDYSFKKWSDNVSNPVWDNDRWWINYILHPYWGSAYYVRGRERGLDRTQSFFYSALLSTLYEYGAEALYEPVSIQDMIVTPVIGSLVGEYLVTPLRESIRAKSGKLTWSDKALLFATDPLGVLNAQVDHMLGVKTTLQFQPIALQPPVHATEIGIRQTNQLGYNSAMTPIWGLQLRMDW